MSSFDQIWWLIVIGGLATSALVVPLRTSTAIAGNGAVPDGTRRSGQIQSALEADDPALSTD